MRLSLVSVRRETISLRQKRRKNGERPQRVAKFTYSPALCNIKYKTVVLLRLARTQDSRTMAETETETKSKAYTASIESIKKRGPRPLLRNQRLPWLRFDREPDCARRLLLLVPRAGSSPASSRGSPTSPGSGSGSGSGSMASSDRRLSAISDLEARRLLASKPDSSDAALPKKCFIKLILISALCRASGLRVARTTTRLLVSDECMASRPSSPKTPNVP